MRILTVNVGSSSLKLALWADGPQPAGEWEARDIGTDRATLAERGKETGREACADHPAALAALLRRLPDTGQLRAVGHRVVHGGANYRHATLLDEAVLRALEALVPLSPLHQPPALAVIRACRERFPDLPHAAVFDTAFHAGLPPPAAVYAVPATWREAFLRRYVFQ
jgi:acetate kinase